MDIKEGPSPSPHVMELVISITILTSSNGSQIKRPWSLGGKLHYGTFHPAEMESTFFSSVYGIFLKTENILGFIKKKFSCIHLDQKSAARVNHTNRDITIYLSNQSEEI